MSKNTEYDDIFSKPQRASDFKFGQTVVSVFDDMVTRSVPFYLEIQRMMTEIAADFAVAGTHVYDWNEIDNLITRSGSQFCCRRQRNAGKCKAA
jgi:hypothetical protein